MSAIRLGGWVLLSVILMACQGAIGSSRAELVVQLPTEWNSGSRSALDAGTAAFPANLAGQLDHFVVSLESGGVPVVPSQSVPKAKGTVSFLGISVGTYDLRVVAWTASSAIAQVLQPVTVAAGSVQNVSTLALVPLVDGVAKGSFDLSFLVDSSVAQLYSNKTAANRLATRISPLAYAVDGSLSTVSAPLSPNVAVLSQTNSSHLRIQSSSAVLTGNYLVELTSSRLDVPGGRLTLATFLVQVFADQTSVLPTDSQVPAVAGGTYPELPSNLGFTRTVSGVPTLSWLAPTVLGASYYQVGYSLSLTATSPEVTPALADGTNANKLSLGTVLHPDGGRYSVAFLANKAPWTGSGTVRLFVRAVYGNYRATDWAIVDVAANTPAPRGLPSIQFDGLQAGTSYELNRTDSTGTQVLQGYSIVTNSDPDHQVLHFPNLTVYPGERLFLSRSNQGTVIENREVLQVLLAAVNPASYDPTQVYYSYAGRDNDLLSPYWYLTTLPYPVPTGVSASLTGIDWVVSAPSASYGVVERKITGSETRWEISIGLFGKGTRTWTAGFQPQAGALELYRLHAGYGIDTNGDNIKDHTLYGPGSPWQAVDQEPPLVAFPPNQWGRTIDVSDSSNALVVEVSVSDQEIEGRVFDPADLRLAVVDGSGTVVLSPTNKFLWFALSEPGIFRWTSDWATYPSDYAAWSALPEGTYGVQVTGWDTAGNAATVTLPLTLIGGPQ